MLKLKKEDSKNKIFFLWNMKRFWLIWEFKFGKYLYFELMQKNFFIIILLQWNSDLVFIW